MVVMAKFKIIMYKRQILNMTNRHSVDSQHLCEFCEVGVKVDLYSKSLKRAVIIKVLFLIQLFAHLNFYINYLGKGGGQLYIILSTPCKGEASMHYISANSGRQALMLIYILISLNPTITFKFLLLAMLLPHLNFIADNFSKGGNI
jgi:hypothetical protein